MPNRHDSVRRTGLLTALAGSQGPESVNSSGRRRPHKAKRFHAGSHGCRKEALPARCAQTGRLWTCWGGDRRVHTEGLKEHGKRAHSAHEPDSSPRWCVAKHHRQRRHPASKTTSVCSPAFNKRLQAGST